MIKKSDYLTDTTGHHDAFHTQIFNEGLLTDCQMYFRLNYIDRAKQCIEDFDFDDGWYVDMLGYADDFQKFISENVNHEHIMNSYYVKSKSENHEKI